MPHPLSRAQRRFQQIKKAEKRAAQVKAREEQMHAEGKQTRQERRESFLQARRRIEERIAEGLRARGLEVNLRAIQHIAFEQAKKELSE